MIGPEKQAALEQRMAALRVSEEDLVEKFILGSGPGGQKINKTSSCVYLKHVPSGIEVKCQSGRSREANRHQAAKVFDTRRRCRYARPKCHATGKVDTRSHAGEYHVGRQLGKHVPVCIFVLAYTTKSYAVSTPSVVSLTRR